MHISALRVKYPDYVPCIIRFENAVVLKLLLPCCTRVSEAHICVRKRMLSKGISVRPEEALFMFVNGKLPVSSSFISDYDTDELNPVTFEMQRETTFG